LERVALFLDHANLQGAFRDLGVEVDYAGLRDYLSDGRFLVDAFIYVPVRPDDPQLARPFTESLQSKGFFVRAKTGKPAGESWKCNVDIEMAIDVLRYVHEARVDIVVIGSGDGDLVPLVKEVRWRGVRCEVASTPRVVARELSLSASGFVDLQVVVEGGFSEMNPSIVRQPDGPPSQD